MKGSFFTPMDQAQNFIKNSVMRDQEGIYVAWNTNPKALEKIIPPQMTPVAPVVFAYIINIQKADFCPRYTEAAISVPCVCGGVQGMYWLQFLLAGPGAEMGTHLGRESIGIPKKIADDITVIRQGNHAIASATRHGIKLVEIEMDINGEYNNEAAKGVLGDPKPGDEQALPGIFLNYKYRKNCEGKLVWSDSHISQMAFNITYHKWEKGTAKVTLQDSIEDPWSELEVVEVLGAGYMNNDIDLAWTKDIMEVDGAEMSQYFLTGRYDKAPLGGGDAVFY